MLQHLGVDEEDDLFGDVRDVVAGTLQLAEHAEQLQAIEGAVRMLADVFRQDGGGVGVDFVHQVVLGKDGDGQVLAFLLEGALGQFEHGEHLGNHVPGRC